MTAKQIEAPIEILERVAKKYGYKSFTELLTDPMQSGKRTVIIEAMETYALSSLSGQGGMKKKMQERIKYLFNEEAKAINELDSMKPGSPIRTVQWQLINMLTERRHELEEWIKQIDETPSPAPDSSRLRSALEVLEILLDGDDIILAAQKSGNIDSFDKGYRYALKQLENIIPKQERAYLPQKENFITGLSLLLPDVAQVNDNVKVDTFKKDIATIAYNYFIEARAALLSDSTDGWVEIKEGCEMPEPDEEIFVYGNEGAYVFIFFRETEHLLRKNYTHWKRISPPKNTNP